MIHQEAFKQENTGNSGEITYKPTETARSVFRKIMALLDQDYSWSAIGRELLPGLSESQSKGIVYRYYMHDDIPKNNEVRMALGLPLLKLQEYIPGKVQTDPCPECGSAPTVCLCDGKRVVKPSKRRPRPPRRAIRLDDPESAAMSLIGANVSREYLHRLAELISI